AVYYTGQLADSNPELAELIGQLSDSVFVAQTSDPVLQAMSDAVVHQNIIAVVHQPTAQPAPRNAAQLAGGMVRIQDPGNAGTIIRTAESAGADYVIATSQTVDIFNPITVRSTAGSIFHLPVYTNVDLTTFVTDFPGQVFAADGYSDVVLDQTDVTVLSKPTAWLFGKDRKSTRLNSSHVSISYAVFCLKKKKKIKK